MHPTQLYESLSSLLLFGLLMLIRRHRKFSGQVFLGWVLGYGILRPLIEVFRDDDDRGIYPLPFTNLSFSTSQYIGGISVILGLGLLVSLVRRYRRDPDGLAPLAHADAGHREWPGRRGASAATGGDRAANKRRKRR